MRGAKTVHQPRFPNKQVATSGCMCPVSPRKQDLPVTSIAYMNIVCFMQLIDSDEQHQRDLRKMT
jgi:hypothetical protein